MELVLGWIAGVSGTAFCLSCALSVFVAIVFISWFVPICASFDFQRRASYFIMLAFSRWVGFRFVLAPLRAIASLCSDLLGFLERHYHDHFLIVWCQLVT